MLKTLADATKKIHQLEASSIKNMHAIANTLKEVKANGLDTASGYADVHDYAQKELGYQKSTTYALVQVAERFLTDKNESILKRKDEKDYTVTQLRELCPLSNEVLMEAIEAGEISPMLSSRKLKDVVKTYKALTVKEDKGNQETEEPETKAQETETEAQEAETASEPSKSVEMSRDWITGSLNQIISGLQLILEANNAGQLDTSKDYIKATKQLTEMLVEQINLF